MRTPRVFDDVSGIQITFVCYVGRKRRGRREENKILTLTVSPKEKEGEFKGKFLKIFLHALYRLYKA